jgi:hypothetical protein
VESFLNPPLVLPVHLVATLLLMAENEYDYLEQALSGFSKAPPTRYLYLSLNIVGKIGGK